MLAPNFPPVLGILLLGGISLLTTSFLVLADEEAKPAACVFPFKYLGSEHSECIDLNAARPWCSTNAVYNGSWVYCAKKKHDLVTNDHFLDILERAEKAAERLNAMKLEGINKGDKCENCQKMMQIMTEDVTRQQRLFMDQNRRIQGLSVLLDKLSLLQLKLKAYHRRRNCRQTTGGSDYLGMKATSSTGTSCQAWAHQSPHRHSETQNSMFPDNSPHRAKNYCRNPENKQPVPWCYTTNSKITFQVCSIPMCYVDCKIDDTKKSSLPYCDEFPDMKCPNNYKYFHGYCYRAEVSRRVNWHEAEKTCRSENAHLASVHSYSENMFLRSLIPAHKKRFWIGLNDLAHEKSFRYTDGTKFDYSYWKTGEPNNIWNEDCVSLNYWSALPQMWNDFECSKSEHFICKTKAVLGK